MADEHDRNDLLSQLLRGWWIISVSVALGLIAAFVGLQVTPATWSATATQLVKGVPGKSDGSDYTAAQYAEARAKSYPEFIFSARVLQGVRDDMGGGFTDQRLREVLSASNRPGTPLVTIAADGTSAEEARDLADSAAEHLARFIEQVETIDGRSPVTVEIAVEAGLPAFPSSPSRGLFLAMGISGGAALGVVLVLLAGAWLDRRSGIPAESTVELPARA